jgi:hypothetical protein
MATGLPRPEPSPAGKLVSDMKRDRGFALLLRLLVGFIFAAAIALAVVSGSPSHAWAKTAPTTVASGDPTVGDEGPRPGPKKSIGTLQVQSATWLRSSPYQAQLPLPVIHLTMAWARIWLSWEFVR